MINNLDIKGGVVIIEKDKKHFMIKQSNNKSLGGQWRHPGGKFEPGENPIDSLIRETKEETNLEIEILDSKPIHVEKIDYVPGYFGFYRARYKSGKLRIEKREVENAGWYSVEEIKKLNLMKATKIFYGKYSHIFENGD